MDYMYGSYCRIIFMNLNLTPGCNLNRFSFLQKEHVEMILIRIKNRHKEGDVDNQGISHPYPATQDFLHPVHQVLDCPQQSPGT